jgi:hypothetical protein
VRYPERSERGQVLSRHNGRIVASLSARRFGAAGRIETRKLVLPSSVASVSEEGVNQGE